MAKIYAVRLLPFSKGGTNTVVYFAHHNVCICVHRQVAILYVVCLLCKLPSPLPFLRIGMCVRACMCVW